MPRIGTATYFLAHADRVPTVRSPRDPCPLGDLAYGGSTTYVVIDDPDAHHARAVAAGAEIVRPLTDQDYGSREYAAKDPGGNVWSFGTYRPS